MADRTYPLFSVLSFLGFILPLIPFSWHVQALNSGTCFFIFWSSLACLNQFVNSIVWSGNTLNPAPWWCEISIRIMMGASVGIPASSLCINRRLYCIASMRTSSISFAEVGLTSILSHAHGDDMQVYIQKRRGVLVDSLICLLFPVVYIALQYVVQGHRFNIVEDIGCYPAVYDTLPAFFISSMWPVVIGLISAVYCGLSLRSFARRRIEFSQFLLSNTTLTIGRYFRLMGLSMTEICATTPLAIFIIYLNAKAAQISPWISWSDTHYNYSRVEEIPAIIWRDDRFVAIAIEFSRWVNPICSFLFFGFFGFAEESKRHYRLTWNWLRDRLFHSRSKIQETLKGRKLQLEPHNVSIPTASIHSVFILPIQDLKGASLAESTHSQSINDKLSCLDSCPSTPESSTFVKSETSNHVVIPFGPSPPNKNTLYRSRTL